MRRIALVGLALALVLTLAACQVKQATSVGQTVTRATVESDGSTLTPIADLAAGTFKLEGTGQAITAGEASELLSLWKAYRALSTDSSSSQAELEALVTQIDGTMTAEQVSAIAAMQLKASDLQAIMQARGIDTQASSGVTGSGSTSSASNGTQASAPADAGGGPSGDLGMGDTPPDAAGAPQDGSAGTTGRGSSSAKTSSLTLLLDDLVTLLSARAEGAA
jgi:hypothetical protein